MPVPLRFFALLALFVLLMWVLRRAIRNRFQFTGRIPPEPPQPESKIYLGHPDKIPLHLRKITLKTCPDCRELVQLDKTSCKYCGCAFPPASM